MKTKQKTTTSTSNKTADGHEFELGDTVYYPKHYSGSSRPSVKELDTSEAYASHLEWKVSSGEIGIWSHRRGRYERKHKLSEEVYAVESNAWEALLPQMEKVQSKINKHLKRINKHIK